MKELSKNLQPMTIGDILDRSIQLYRSNFLKFIGIILLIKGPYLILESFLINLIESSAAAASYSPGTALLFVKFLEPLFIVPILTAAMIIPISERFLGREIGIKEAYSRLLTRLFPLLGTILLSAPVIGMGFLFFVIPGAILWILFAFIPQTVVIDGEGGISALKRSKYLVKGYFGKTFILLILIFVAVSLITGVVSFGIIKLLPFLGAYGISLGMGAANVISVLLEPFKVAAMTLLYYDLRIRKEGFDLEIMAQELEDNMNDDYAI